VVQPLYFRRVWRAADEPGLDLVVDAYTQAANGRAIVTAAIYADVAVRWPQVFAFSQIDPLPFTVKEPAAEKEKSA
jgi:hypothetical protein